MESIKEKVKYIKIKDLNGRYSLSKTKSGIINADDSWVENYPKYFARGKIYDRHDAVEKYEWKALEDSIKIHGIKKPLLANWKGSGYVADGNHRLAVLKLLYSPNKKVPCVWIPPSAVWTEREIKKELEFHENEINTLEDDVVLQHANVGKIIKIY